MINVLMQKHVMFDDENFDDEQTDDDVFQRISC